VDPYYLIHKARQAGYSPDVISAGRRVNDSIGEHIAEWVVRLMIDRGFAVKGVPVLLLGLTFKENTPDIRNTRVVDVRHHLQGWGASVDVCDPLVDPDEVETAYGFRPVPAVPAGGDYAAVIVAVAHDEFRQWGANGIRGLGRSGCVLFDARGIFPRDEVDARL
jgi:UDP-N-acetyl-D-galactosamine dehydrogenase